MTFLISDKPTWIKRLTYLILILFFVFALQRAWLCDDAYITFRTVDNFTQGYRLTWNVIERVQAYTHPLWMFVLSSIYFFTQEIYFSTIFLTLTISTLAIILFTRFLPQSDTGKLLALLILVLSNAYIDYATSGLENPLTHLLLVIFFITYFNNKPSIKNIFFLSLIASFAGVNRLDTILFTIPAILYRLWQFKQIKGLLLAACGQIPLLLWELFSLFYYGFPFPNTYYAKLNTAIPAGESLKQGIHYYINTLQLDPITLTAIIGGIVLGLANKDRKNNIPVILGFCLYLLYIIKIGGDFMSGRFFTAPLLCAVILIARFDFSKMHQWKLTTSFALVVLLGFLAPLPTFLSQYPAGTPVPNYQGIVDERLWYFSDFGLFQVNWTNNPPETIGKDRGLQAREAATNDLHAIAIGNTGVYGYYAGPNVFIIDKYALSDPLLARLPAIYSPNWRIGHFERVVPDGYIATIYKQGQLADENLALYYEKLSIVTQSSLSDPQRLKEILNFNLGKYDYLIDKDAYRFPED